jgi:cytochrome c oxidase cbb3-type subunit III
MSSRSLTSAAVVAAFVLLQLAACSQGAKSSDTAPPIKDEAVITSAFEPGVDHSLVTIDPRAAHYYDNAEAVNTGKRLYSQYNCSGCHSNGGGGMGPPLMDDQWIYGGRLEQIHDTLVEGRPNGMPSWGGKIPDEQLWQIAAYVRSMSLPQTLAAQNGPTASQSPAPVPRAADQDAVWSAPPDTTNDYTTLTEGPK